MKKIVFLFLLFCIANNMCAQKSTDLQERALNGKIKTIIQYDYNKEICGLKNEKIKDALKWYRKIVYNYDTVGNLQLQEVYVKCLPSYDCDMITVKIFRKEINNQIVYESFDEHDTLLQESYVLPTSETTYTIETYDAKTKALIFTNEQVLNTNYRDIGSLFSVFQQENGINKLIAKRQYYNTIDENGRLLKSIEKEFQENLVAEIETLYQYPEFDEQENPILIIQQKSNEEEPFLLSTREYKYY